MNYYIFIIINVYYNYIINKQYNYYISYNGLLEKCDKEENLDVTGGVSASCLKRRL